VSGKTTTALTLARELADQGRKVLLIDGDPQGSLLTSLDIKTKPLGYFHQIVIEELSPETVATEVVPNLDIVFGNRTTHRAESVLSGATAREQSYKLLFTPAEEIYDVIIFDMAPSISHIQRCSIAYTQNVLIPVGMDDLSIEGARAAIVGIEHLNELNLMCRPVGFLPTMVNQRLIVTRRVLSGLEAYSRAKGVPILHAIRTDQSVTNRQGQFLQDFDNSGKAMEDYRAALGELLTISEGRDAVKTEAAAV
jgi:chromosome partitioning protein